MRNIFKILIIFFLSVFIYSCKESEPVAPGPSEVVLFSQDSLSLSSSDSGNVDLTALVQYDIDSSVTNIKLEYRMESSGGVTGDRIFYGVYLSKPGISFFADYNYIDTTVTVIDTSRTFNVMNYRGLTLKFNVAIEKKTDYSYRYVRFRNMKLSRLN